MELAVAYSCVMVAALLPYVWVGIAKSLGKRYDNLDPRGWMARQDDPRVRRANAAHLNAFEAFPAFAAGVALSQLAGVEEQRIATLAVVFVVARVAHGGAYLADHGGLRSLSWFAGIGSAVALLLLAALAAAAA